MTDEPLSKRQARIDRMIAASGTGADALAAFEERCWIPVRDNLDFDTSGLNYVGEEPEPPYQCWSFPGRTWKIQTFPGSLKEGRIATMIDVLADHMKDALEGWASAREASGRYKRSPRMSFAPETIILRLSEAAPGEGHGISFSKNGDTGLWTMSAEADDPRRDSNHA